MPTQTLNVGTSAASKVSEYLTTGMHHSTQEAQKRLSEIITLEVAKEMQNYTPTEFCARMYSLSKSKEFDYSI